MTIKLSWLITWKFAHVNLFHPWHSIWKCSTFPSKTNMFSLFTVKVFRSCEINTRLWYTIHKHLKQEEVSFQSCSEASQPPPPLLSEMGWEVPQSPWSCSMAYTDSGPAKLLQWYHIGCRSSKACLLYKQVSLVAINCLSAQELLLLKARVEKTGAPTARATPRKYTEISVASFKFLASLL